MTPGQSSWSMFYTSTRHWVTLVALTSVEPAHLAASVNLPLDEFLTQVKQWSDGPGFPYGIAVDLERKTITQLGRQRKRNDQSDS